MTNAGSGTPDPSPSWRRCRPALVVFLLAVTAGLPSLRGGFFGGDDRDLILNFGLINHPSLEHAWQLLTVKAHRFLYQPVPLLTFAGEFKLLGWLGLSPLPEAANSGAWLLHLTNVLIHTTNALLVWRLIRRLHEDRRVAFVAAVLFAVHPLAVEATAWLNGRMTSLSAMFCLAALNTMEAWARAGVSGPGSPGQARDPEPPDPGSRPPTPKPEMRRRTLLPVLVILFVMLAMTSKVQVGLPALMLVLPLARRRWPSRPWWALWAVCAAITVGFAALNFSLTSRTHLVTAAAETLKGSRFARTSFALGWYLQRYVCPVGLAYVHPTEPLVTWSSPGVQTGLATLVAATAIAVVSLRWSRAGALGFAWFLAAVAATLPLIPSRNVAVAERYTYLPNIGLDWAVAAFAVFVWRRLRSRTARFAVGGIGAAYALALLATTWRVASFYRNDLAGDLRVVQVYPRSSRVWESLAWTYHRAGRYTDAIDAARRELANHPERAGRACQAIGMSELELGQTNKAIETLQAAVRAEPGDGKAWYRLARAHEQAGDFDQAIENYRSAIDRMPNHGPSHAALANLLRRRGRIDEAVRCYERVLANNPYDSPAALAMAEIDIAAGRTGKAAARLERLVSWMPENWIAWTNLGVCYANQGREADAVAAYRRALAANPQADTAALNLAGILLRQGDAAGAGSLLDRLTAGNNDRTMLWAVHDLLVTYGQAAKAEQLWSDAAKREPGATDLRAARAWACVLGGHWDTAKELANAATTTGPAPPLVQMTLAVIAMAQGDPAPAVAWVNQTTSATRPAHTEDQTRMRQALMVYGERHPDEPWPYYLMARLLQAEGNTAAAAVAMRLFGERCANPTCREQATRLGIANPEDKGAHH